MGPMNVKLSPLGMLVVAVLCICLVYYVYVVTFGHSDSKETSPSVGEKGDISLKRLLSVGIEVAQRGGDVVREVRMGSPDELGEKSKGKTKEGAKELYTDGDMKSHRAMYYGIKKVFPDVNIISEEHDQTGSVTEVLAPRVALTEVDRVIHGDKSVPIKDVTIWIDPLDATQEYTENLLDYVTTMVCVAVSGKPVIGIIHSPFGNRQTVWAWVGIGKSESLDKLLAERKQKLTEQQENAALKSSTSSGEMPQKVIVSRSHTGTGKSVVSDAFGNDTSVIPAGGAGYKVLKVLDGTVNAYVHVTAIKKWDICAGNALLNAVNGHMTDLGENNISYSPDEPVKNEKGLLATVGNSHSKLLQLLQNKVNL